MNNFLAQCVHQLDLALDQISIKDTNYDRFALILIDNAVELALHNYAEYYKYDLNDIYTTDKEKYNKIINSLGNSFNAKVSLAVYDSLIPIEYQTSLNLLHKFRNEAYHSGMVHDSIIHSLSIFYFKIACNIFNLLHNQDEYIFSIEKLPYRALKYIYINNSKVNYANVWQKLKEIIEINKSTLVNDLSLNMNFIIENADNNIGYLGKYMPGITSREGAIFCCQNMEVVFHLGDFNMFDPVDKLKKSIIKQRKFRFIEDPIKNWKKQHSTLLMTKDEHKALKLYCDFIDYTEGFCKIIQDRKNELEQILEDEYQDSKGN